jgi:hypothetical protein
MERHFFNPIIKDHPSKMARPYKSSTSCSNHFAATFEHVSSYIIYERASYVFRTAHNNIVGGIGAIATAAMCGEEIVPSIVIA